MPPISLPSPSIVLCLIVAFVLAGELFLRRWIEENDLRIDDPNTAGAPSERANGKQLYRLRWWFRTFVFGVFLGFTMSVDIGGPVDIWTERDSGCPGYTTHYESWLVWADRSAPIYADAATIIETELMTAVPCITF